MPQYEINTAKPPRPLSQQSLDRLAAALDRARAERAARVAQEQVPPVQTSPAPAAPAAPVGQGQQSGPGAVVPPMWLADP